MIEEQPTVSRERRADKDVSVDSVAVNAKEEEPILEEEPTAEEEDPPPKKDPVAEEKAAEVSDYSLYKCQGCGQMVLGFEKEKHVKEVHRGEEQEFSQL